LAKAGYERHGINFARQIGAKNIIGYVPEDLSQAKGLPDVRLPTPDFTSLHEVEAVNGLLKSLNINDALGPLQVYADPKVVARVAAQIPGASKRIALHISAREPERRWGIEHFVALAKHIQQTQPDTQILLFWSPGKADDPHHPGDDEAAQALMNALPGDRLIPMPTQNLTELIAALSLCDVFIGTDGGAMHLAVALNKKILALFENLPGKLNHWYPWRVTNQVVCSSIIAKPDISQITTEQVFRALDALLHTNA
jgi:ADP-heptose:LPS heptosyltransferase